MRTLRYAWRPPQRHYAMPLQNKEMALGIFMNLKEILEAVEGHGKYHISAYDGPVLTVEDGMKEIKELMWQTYRKACQAPSMGLDECFKEELEKL